ncbi:hypothetical protein BJL95_11210 [Methylomonas sp. LWB]|nr:hypothetical protein BJL95_11210 [Methylomonas sp. LWB]
MVFSCYRLLPAFRSEGRYCYLAGVSGDPVESNKCLKATGSNRYFWVGYSESFALVDLHDPAVVNDDLNGTKADVSQNLRDL